ncbi:MAG TPA: hypothetical protein VNM16_08770 [Bacillota bacterium]|nr:hypothetical protein [Bacillota bacterium]
MFFDDREVMRALGYRDGRTRPSQAALAAVAEGMAAARGLLQPLSLQATEQVACDESFRVPDLGLVWDAPALRTVFAGAERVTLYAGTVGSAISDAARAAFSEGEYTRAVVLDACGSAAVQALAERVRREVAEAADEAGYGISAPYSPGYRDWDIADNDALLKALEARRIGLRSSAAHYLVPEKSFCGAIAWVRGAGEAAHGCAVCRLAGCRYRKREVVLR